MGIFGKFVRRVNHTHTDGVSIPMVQKPPFMRYYREPVFNSKVIRISNNRPDELTKPPYSTMQAWNADETLLLQYYSKKGKGGHQLLDGHTYKHFRDLDFVPSDLEDVYWSRDDPDTMFYISKVKPDIGKLMKYSVRKNASTIIKDFSPWCGKAMPVPGGGVQMQSLDDDNFGFRCRTADKKRIMLTYKVSTDTVVTAPIGKGTRWSEWFAPTPTPSGRTWWYQGTSLMPDLQTIDVTMDMSKFSEHQNLGLDHNGEDAMYSTGFDPSPKGCAGDPDDGVGHVIEHNMKTGKCRNLIGEAHGYPYTRSATHISAQAYRRPGWVAVSSVGYEKDFKYFSNGKKAPALHSEIYLASTDPDNPVVCRLAHHRSYGKLAENGDYPSYFAEPHVTISPTGTRLIFGSDWYDSGSIDSYVIELKQYKRP